jgi:glycosyltransferase involved in cell wall biosynthesis
MPKVSLIIPCLNESRFIGDCLESVLRSDFESGDLEVLVVDGESDDGTARIIDSYADRFPRIRRLNNPRRNTPAALNVGLAHARGDIIVRLDAHAIYPSNYIPLLVQWLESSGADNVGGIWETLPADQRKISRAIAIALSHPFGVGNAYFRIGTQEPRWVDTVPFGCYRRQVFERIGSFDEELLRNQDDEFNYRLIKSGGRILLVPEISSKYFARDSYQRLWRMYFQYGLFKPLVIKKTGFIVRIRHLVPALFVMSLVFSAAIGLWIHPFLVFAVVMGACYAGAAMYASVTVSLARRDLVLVPWLWMAFATIHFAYGLGFLCGLCKLLTRKSGAVPTPAKWIAISR